MKKNIGRIISILLIISLILLPYGSYGMSYGTLIIVLALFIIFVSGRWKMFYLPKGYMAYILYTLLIPPLCAAAMYGVSSFSILNIVLIVSLPYFLRNVNVQELLIYYKYLIIFSIIVFGLQELSYFLTGTRFSALIPSLPIVYDGMDGINMSDFRIAQAESERSSSIFLEAAQFAQILIPFLIIELFTKEKISQNAIALTAVLLLLRSGNGLLLMAIVWGIRLFVYRQSSKKFLFLLLLAPVIILGVKYYISLESSTILIERFNGIENNVDNSTQSGFIRIFRGYYLFGALPLEVKLFGLSGLEALNVEILGSKVYWLFNRDLYLNSFQDKLVYLGIIGTCLYYGWILSYFSKITICGKVILISFLVLSFMASISFPIFLLYFLLAVSFNKTKNGI